jgi:hypothetical protein
MNREEIKWLIEQAAMKRRTEAAQDFPDSANHIAQQSILGDLITIISNEDPHQALEWFARRVWGVELDKS